MGFQYSAEVTMPAPESTSQGLILFIGQVSGVLFILGMNVLGMVQGLMVFIGLAFVTIFLSLFLHESEMVRAG